MKIQNKAGLTGVVLACCLWAVGHFESSGKLHLIPYRDIAGNWTVCDGHTGKDVIPGQAWTEQRCKDQKIEDLANARADVASCVVRPLTDGQWIGYTDFAYNVGGTKFCRSSMAKFANAGKSVQSSCAPIIKYVWIGKRNCWNHSNNCYGIIERRQWEYQKCISDIPTIH